MSTPSADIEVRLRELSQLFNSLDPSPFHERDLDADAEAYIVGWARELPAGQSIRLVFHLPPDEVRKAHSLGMATALAHYFSERAAAVDRDLNELHRTGRRYLSIGVPVLVGCLAASQIARLMLGSGAIARLIEESLLIVGWVANWKPIETFLYDRWPLQRRRNLYQRLAAANIEIRPA